MQSNDIESPLSGITQDGNQFLTFQLQEEEYGIEILRVQEIKGFSRITPIPNTPQEIKGVMNLRGTVVPVIDLRIKFGLPQAEYNQFTVIIVVTVANKVLGLVVDAVSDVLNIVKSEIEAAPEFAGADMSFLTGMARAGERFITLLNIDRLVGKDEMACTGSTV